MAPRHLLLLATALLSAGSAQATKFQFTGSIETYVVPTAGTYRILAKGAPGGGSQRLAYGALRRGNSGGSGGVAAGIFSLNAGDTFSVVVGGAGGSAGLYGSGGGGGASWVFAGATPYVVGGGGGGAAGNGYDGPIDPAGFGEDSTGVGGTGFGGLLGSADGGAGGAGWLGDGQLYPNSDPSVVGKSRPSFAGGVDQRYSAPAGGFGGGGAASNGIDSSTPGYASGGGGGGYSGGSGSFGPGSAGTSYVAPFALSNAFATGSRGGLVQITAVPEPASWALLLTGFGLVGGVLRGRRLRAA